MLPARALPPPVSVAVVADRALDSSILQNHVLLCDPTDGPKDGQARQGALRAERGRPARRGKRVLRYHARPNAAGAGAERRASGVPGAEDPPPTLLAGAPPARPSTMLVGTPPARRTEGGQKWSVAMFVNTMPRYEILSGDAVGVLERGWRRIVSEIGIQFAKPEAVELFRKAGQQVDGDVVRLDPEFVLEQVAKAPREFDVQARNPANSVHIGGDHMVFSGVYGCPFVREGEVRRDATLDDFRRLSMLAQSFPELDSAGGVICEPNDAPLDSRHLDMIYALQTVTDKIYMGNVVSGPNAADTIAMTSILFGGREKIEQTPATISLINCNSPLRWDDRMLDAQFEYCAANQAVVLTPFLLMGAMSPVTIPAALTQQLAEALSGIALAQLIRPGCPVIFGSFLSNIDMQSGSPAFGTPESAIGLLCTGQLARHYGLPFRTGGGLNASQTADAQCAYEALMTLLPTFLAGTNFVMHAAGWLEGGLVSCYEKFIIDVELLRMLRVEFTPLEIDEASLAFGAHEEVGHGGHFLGAAHTMERFRDCFYRPLLSSTANYERWLKQGGKDTAARAGEICQRTLAEYEPPPMDEAVRAELQDYVDRRRAELGD
ncbi:MAG TPA: trimethylamine methyltransferase family protein [Streptosporangiaceae bacterium]|nr:trimethylamine methyltransferase family protein [Streptosporangiaceae bacterium]